MSLTTMLDWFAGGERRYMVLSHCMQHDVLWIAITVLLDLAVAGGYLLIALHWWKNQKAVAESPAKSALGNLRNIFLFCGICGYIFIPIKMFWPAWRLYDLFMGVLAYYTWRYAWDARDLKVVFNELGRSRQLAEDLERSRDEARRKSYFLNAISHDLRTPLNGLMLQAQLAEMGLESDDPAMLRDALVEIRSSVRVTSEMLDGFLEIGRLDWTHDLIQPSRFRARELLDQVARSVQPMAADKGLSLAVEVPPALSIRTDRAKLERILFNLMGNGIKFTTSGGVRLVARASGPDATIEVIDTGIGIAPADRGRLFEEFYQVHNRERDRTKGYGLGLAIARRLAQQLGGGLEVESEPGLGSRFLVRLPGAVVADGPSPDRGGEPRPFDVAVAPSPAAG